MENLRRIIEAKAEERKRSEGTTQIEVDELQMALSVYEDKTFSVAFSLRDILEYADSMHQAIAASNEALLKLRTERMLLLGIVATEEQKSSMLELMTRVSH